MMKTHQPQESRTSNVLTPTHTHFTSQRQTSTRFCPLSYPEIFSELYAVLHSPSLSPPGPLYQPFPWFPGLQFPSHTDRQTLLIAVSDDTCVPLKTLSRPRYPEEQVPKFLRLGRGGPATSPHLSLPCSNHTVSCSPKRFSSASRFLLSLLEACALTPKLSRHLLYATLTSPPAPEGSTSA